MSDDTPADRRPAHNDAVKVARQVQITDIKWLMSHKQGRRIVSRLMGETGVYQTSFTGSSETFYREGRRAIGLLITDEVTRHAWSDYLQMLTEQKAPA